MTQKALLDSIISKNHSEKNKESYLYRSTISPKSPHEQRNEKQKLIN